MTALSNSITLALDKSCEAASSSCAPQALLSTPRLLKKTAPERPLSPTAAATVMIVMVAMTLVALESSRVEGGFKMVSKSDYDIYFKS